jgi:hypothetical protein
MKNKESIACISQFILSNTKMAMHFIGDVFSSHVYKSDNTPSDGWMRLLDKYYKDIPVNMNISTNICASIQEEGRRMCYCKENKREKLSYDMMKANISPNCGISIMFDGYICEEFKRILESTYESDLEKVKKLVVPIDYEREAIRLETNPLKDIIKTAKPVVPIDDRDMQFMVTYQFWYNALHRWEPNYENTFSCHGTPVIPSDYMPHFIVKLSEELNDSGTAKSLSGVMKYQITDTVDSKQVTQNRGIMPSILPKSSNCDNVAIGTVPKDVWFIVFDGFPYTIFDDHICAWSPSVDFDDGLTSRASSMTGQQFLTSVQIGQLSQQFANWHDKLIQTNYESWNDPIFNW